jgi:hypothetical protein
MSTIRCALIGIALIATPQHVRGQNPPAGASGSIEWKTVLGADASATFTVRARDGRGEIMVRNHDGISFSGTILCYYRRSGSSVTFSGTIDSFEGSNLPRNNQGTSAFLMAIQDGGADRGSDLVSLVRSATPLHCAAARIPDRPLTQGNLTIH